MERICTHMTEMPIDTFRDKSFSDLPESVQRKLAFAQETNGKYLTLLDMLQDGAGAGGVPEIIQHIETAIAEGERPDLVIVDWFGAMVDRNHQFRSDIPHDLRYRVLGTQFMDMFNMYAKKSGVSFLLLHQLSTEASSHSSGHRPKKTDALELLTLPFIVCCMLLDHVQSSVCFPCSLQIKAQSTKSLNLLATDDGILAKNVAY
jgi:hypothetical protein